MKNQKFAFAVGLFMLAAVCLFILAGWFLVIRWCFTTYGMVAGAFAIMLPIMVLTGFLIWYYSHRLS